MMLTGRFSLQISLKPSENQLKRQKEKGKKGQREGKKKVPPVLGLLFAPMEMASK